jgi:hypothetical protein
LRQATGLKLLDEDLEFITSDLVISIVIVFFKEAVELCLSEG